jgi:hypothetical protein
MMPRVARADVFDATAFCNMCGPSRIEVSELIDRSSFCEGRGPALAPNDELAGFCDVRGASDIAPLPIIRLSDAAIDGIEAVAIAPESRGYVAIEGRGLPAIPDAGAYDLPVLPQHVMVMVPRSYETELVTWFASDAGPRQGWSRSVDHPPR